MCFLRCTACQEWCYEYNPLGKVIRETDPLGRTTIYTYDTNGIDLLEKRQVNGQDTELLASFTYNDKHEPLTATDASGQTTTYTYLSDGRLQTIVSPPRDGLSAAERTTTYSYYPDTDPAARAGRLQAITGPSTAQGAPTTTYTYDAFGRARTMTDPDNYTLTYDYDALDRPTRVTYPDSTYEETVYNRLDVEKRRDRLGRWTYMFNDALRRVVATRDPLGRTTQYQYGGAGCASCGGGDNLTKLIDPNGSATSWDYDLQGRVTTETRANGAEYLTTYESTTGRVHSTTDPKGNVKTYAYNLDDSTSSITYTVAEGTASTPNVSFTYDPVYARVTTMTGGTGTTNYTYWPITSPPTLGAGKVKSVDGPLDNDTTDYSYDELGREISRQIGSAANTQSQHFDPLGRLDYLTNALGTFTYTYDGDTGRRAGVTYPNGQQTTWAYYDGLDDHQLREIHNKRPGGATLSRFEYTYDKAANILTWLQQADADQPKVYALSYDAADQLTAAILKSTDPTPTILKRYYYAYDSAGNRTAEQIDDAVTGATYNNMNQLASQQAGGALVFKGTVSEPASVSVGGRPATATADNRFEGPAVVPSGTGQVQVVATDPSGNVRTNTYEVSQGAASKTFTYDANGNLTSDGSRTFEWDAENRLVAVTVGTQRSEFTYDGFWRRVRTVERVGGEVQKDTRAVWCGMELCEERAADGVTVTRRVFSHGEQADGALRYFTTDHLGSVREVTDASGALLARYAFDPWGRRTLTAGTDLTDAGLDGHRQARSGLSLALYRGYDAEIGRWVEIRSESAEALTSTGTAMIIRPTESTRLVWSRYVGASPTAPYLHHVQHHERPLEPVGAADGEEHVGPKQEHLPDSPH